MKYVTCAKVLPELKVKKRKLIYYYLIITIIIEHA